MTATVRYHREPEGWWAETEDLPTFSAAGSTFAEVRGRVFSALVDLLGADIEILEDLSSVGIDFPLVVGRRSATFDLVYAETPTPGYSETKIVEVV